MELEVNASTGDLVIQFGLASFGFKLSTLRSLNNLCLVWIPFRR